MSLWFAHGNVNGLDFWTDRAKAAAHKDNQITHREFVTVEPVGGQAKIVTRNDWISEGKKICEDERTLLFGGDSRRRVGSTLSSRLKPRRVISRWAKPKKARSASASRARSPLMPSRARRSSTAAAKTMPTPGACSPIGSTTTDQSMARPSASPSSITPATFRNPTRWHARTYGLLAANPFGDAEFPPDPTAPKQAAVNIAKGDELALRYRVLLHRGDPAAADIAEAYKAFAASSSDR